MLREWFRTTKGWCVQMSFGMMIKYLTGQMTKRVLRAAVDAAAAAAAETANPVDDVVCYIAGKLVDGLPGGDD